MVRELLNENLRHPVSNPYFVTEAFWVTIGQAFIQPNIPERAAVRIKWRRGNDTIFHFESPLGKLSPSISPSRELGGGGPGGASCTCLKKKHLKGTFSFKGFVNYCHFCLPTKWQIYCLEFRRRQPWLGKNIKRNPPFKCFFLSSSRATHAHTPSGKFNACRTGIHGAHLFSASGSRPSPSPPPQDLMGPPFDLQARPCVSTNQLKGPLNLARGEGEKWPLVVALGGTVPHWLAGWCWDSLKTWGITHPSLIPFRAKQKMCILRTASLM